MSGMHNPAHPGEVLKEGWPAEVTITEAAKQLGVTRAALSRILIVTPPATSSGHV